MLKRLIPSAALAVALMVAPSQGRSQVAASVSLNLGLFDGVGMGLAVSHWNRGSLFSPGFHFDLGASVGLGFGLGFSSWGGGGSGYGYGYDDYYYDSYGYNDYYYDATTTHNAYYRYIDTC